MYASPPPSILFVGRNRGIGMEGWAAVASALFSKRNMKKLDLGEERGNESSCDTGRNWA
jgi:hypothetical protein